VADGGGAVSPDLMAAPGGPRPTPAQVDQEEAAASAQQQGTYQPAVIEQTPVAAPPPALPAARPVFQVAPSYQPSYAPAAPVPPGTHLAQTSLPPPPPAAPAIIAADTPRSYAPAPIVGPGGMQNLAMEPDAPVTRDRSRANGGLHFITPAEADTLPLYSTAHSGGWAIQVGAYGTMGDARAAVESARRHERYALASARTIVMPVHVSQHLLYRARLSGLSETAAVNACETIRGRSPCMVLSPDALSE
jgi:hypothetical protein